MEISKGRKKLIDFARKQFKQEIQYMEKHNYHCGVRFYSDKLVNDMIKEGKSIGNALSELAKLDFNNL